MTTASNLSLARAAEILSLVEQDTVTERELCTNGKFDDVLSFVSDDNAQSVFEDMIDAIYDVAVENGQAPEDWDDVSCDGSFYSAVESMGPDYAEAIDDDEIHGSTFGDFLRRFADQLIAGKSTDERDRLESDVRNAKNLEDLRDALESADAYAKRAGIDEGALTGIFTGMLPTFGGPEVDDHGAFSWDEDSILYGFGEWTVEPRGREFATIDQRPPESFIEGENEYRIEDRFYLGADQIDSLKITRWTQTEDVHTWTYNGFVTIPAFPRDCVLLSEMVEAVESAFDEVNNREEDAA